MDKRPDDTYGWGGNNAATSMGPMRVRSIA